MIVLLLGFIGFKFFILAPVASKVKAAVNVKDFDVRSDVNRFIE